MLPNVSHDELLKSIIPFWAMCIAESNPHYWHSLSNLINLCSKQRKSKIHSFDLSLLSNICSIRGNDEAVKLHFTKITFVAGDL